MNKFSTEQLPKMLFLRAFEIANMIGKNDDIFPEKQTPDDHEKLMHYALVLFQVHDKTHGEKINNDIFHETIIKLYETLIEKGVFVEDDAIERAKQAYPSMNDFLSAHLKFLRNSSNSDSIIQYTSEIFSMIPSCKGLGAFSIPGVSFASLLPEVIEAVSISYGELIASWDKSQDKPHKAPSNHSDDFIMESYPPTETKSAEKKKKPVALIICAIALICSLIGNVYQSSSSAAAIEKSEMLSRELASLQSRYATKEADAEKYYKKYAEIKDEYAFYHNGAVIVTTNGTKYHTFECSHWDYPIWIYNDEAARLHGYTPCLDCDPPQ